MHICKYDAIHESYFMIAEMWKAPQETHIHITAKSKSTSSKLKEEICFILKIHYSSEQKKIDKQIISWQTIGKCKRTEGVTFFRGCNFYMKNKLKSEIFNGKKIYK